MRITLGSGNRITIPREIVNQLGWNPGNGYELQIKDNSIVITALSEVTEDNTLAIKPKHLPVGLDIVSNIEDKDKYANPKLSPCGLVVRSKNMYVKQFCDKCKGKLVEGDIKLQCICPHTDIDDIINSRQEEVKSQPSLSDTPSNCEKFDIYYNKKEECIKYEPKKEVNQEVEVDTYKPKSRTKIIIEKLTENVNALNDKLDNKIKQLNTQENKVIEQPKVEAITQHKKDKKGKEQHHTGNTVMEFVTLDDFIKCRDCQEFFRHGMYLDGAFHCVQCAKKDFKKYLEEKEGNE